MEDYSFGKILRKLRKEKGWTQEDLAGRIHVSKQHISNFENDRRMPRMDAMRKIADCFNVTPNDLLEITDEDIHEAFDETDPACVSETDRYLAEAMSSNNPYLLDEAVRAKQRELDEQCVKIKLEDFIQFSFKRQLEEIRPYIKKGDFRLLGLARELAFRYVSEAFASENDNQMQNAHEALSGFVRNFPLNKLRNAQQERIWGGVACLYELSADVAAEIETQDSLYATPIRWPEVTPEGKQRLKQSIREETGREPTKMSVPGKIHDIVCA